MTRTTRGRLSGVIAAAVVLSLGGLIERAMEQRHRERSDSPGAEFGEATDGPRMRKVHHVQVVGGVPVLEFDVEEAVVRRTKLGIFRIGFSHELALRTADLRIHVGAGRLESERDVVRMSGREVAAILRGTRSGRGELTGVIIDGFAFQLSGDGGARLALRAARLVAGLGRGGDVSLRGGVIVDLDGKQQIRFDTLDFDPTIGSFVGATIAHPRGEGRDAVEARETETALTRVNAHLDRILRPGRGSPPPPVKPLPRAHRRWPHRRARTTDHGS